MKKTSRVGFVSAFLVCFGAMVSAQERIENWTAPRLWSPPAKLVPNGELAPLEAAAAEAVPTPPLHFVGLSPCRLVDTRGNGFTGQYGPPALTQGVPRNFVLAGECGISATAQAVSLNVTVTNPQGPGFILIYPQGSAQPTVSTLNYVAGQTVANAAVVPLGTGGGITVIAGVSGTDLIIDTNGEYGAGVVTTLNGLSGNVTLASESKSVTITPSGQTLFLSVNPGPGGFLPSGTMNQTLRHDGEGWAANSALTSDGTNVALTGALAFPAQVQITTAGTRFLHNFGTDNTFLGRFAGNFTMTGQENTAIGLSTLPANTSGNFNTALGGYALQSNTAGSGNTAIGDRTLAGNGTGSSNTAIGSLALVFNTSGSSNTAVGYQALDNNDVGNYNTALGHMSLFSSETGNSNIAIGHNALSHISSGSNNIGIGENVGSNVYTGGNNIYIGNAGFNDESGQIRIGTVANITGGTVIVGISGFGSSGGIPVIVNAGGRLGTTTSSARFKEDVRNIDSESDGLMKLRPVAFRYKESHEPGRLPQYGLIAEEVAEVYPELVVNDDKGRPFAIRSQLLDPLLLNEVQKQRRSIDAQRTEIENLKAQLAKLEARLDGRSEP